MRLVPRRFHLIPALVAAMGAGLAACDQPLATRAGPRPVVNPEIEAAAAAARVDPAQRAAAQAMLERLVADWNAPGSVLRAEQASALAYTLHAARAAEAERGAGGTTSVPGLMARARRAAAAADAAASAAAGGVTDPR